MDDFVGVAQSNWVELAILCTQVAILAVLVWFARTSLRILATRARTGEAQRAARVSAQVSHELIDEAPPVMSDAVSDEVFEGAAHQAHHNGHNGRNGASAAQPATARGWVREPQAQVAYGGVGRMLSPAGDGPRSDDDVVFEPARARAARPADSHADSMWRAVVRWLQQPMNPRAVVAWRRTIMRQHS